MLNRKEIQKRLSGVPRDFVVGFAVRATMRVLPLLAVSEKKYGTFWYWGDKTIQRLFDVLNAQRFGFMVATAGVGASRVAVTTYGATYVDADAVVAGIAADAAKAQTTAYAVAYGIAAAAHSAAADSYDDTASTFAAAADAADASITAAEDVLYEQELQTIIQSDLKSLSPKKFLRLNKSLLINNGSDFSTALDYVIQPLWLGEPPQRWLADWERFKQAVLSVDAGFSGFLDWFDDRIAGKPVDLDLLRKQALLPEEILAQDVASINAYLNALAYADTPLNRARAIFMGHGAAGKTSLVRCLLGEAVIEGEEDMTPGIDIREWPLPDSPVRAHLWDFGGQVIAHATHQFFLRTGCLYVLVMDARAEINATEQAQYWLEHVKAFAGSAPVMLVGNKADQVRITLDLQTLQERYPNIVGFYNLSCTRYQTDYQPDFNSFKRDFVEQLAQLDLHQVRFLDAHFNAMEALKAQSREQAFLTQFEFRGFCDGAGVKQNGGLDQNWLLDTLDKLGVIIHFSDLKFHDAYVLNPRWLTYGVYTLLYSDEAKASQGHLTRAQVVAILQREEIEDEQGFVLTYPTDKCGFIIEAMRSFKLCYFLKNDENMLVIPDLLPPNRPELDFDKERADIVFEFRFPHLLPRHVMPMFIVSRHHEIDNDQVWQTGVVLNNGTHKTRALVTVNYSDRTVTLHLHGASAKDYLHILHDEMMQIIHKLKDLSFEEWVELPQSALIESKDNAIRPARPEKADYRQLLGTLRAGQTVYISTSGLQYDVFKVLGGIMTNETVKKETGGKYIINNNGQLVVNKGEMKNTAVGGDVNITIAQQSDNLNNELRQLIDVIQIEVDASADREKALRELAIMREQVTLAVKGGQYEKQDAKSRLLEFADKLKNGVGYVAQVTTDVATIKEKLPGIVAAIAALVGLL